MLQIHFKLPLVEEKFTSCKVGLLLFSVYKFLFAIKMLKLALTKLILLIFILVFTKSETWGAEETPPWFNELFGDGSFDVDAIQFVAKHLSR